MSIQEEVLVLAEREADLAAAAGIRGDYEQQGIHEQAVRRLVRFIVLENFRK
jgi:hypothetical protein